ncbi:MAG: hypothetical protein PHW02_08410 [bacterium]|nr:hypothetical protein [bacterium]
MKIDKILMTILMLTLLFTLSYAGEKKDIVEAVKVNKIAELLDLDEGLISQLIKVESKLKKMQKDFEKSEDSLIGKLEKSIEDKNYEKTDEIIDSLENLERRKLDESLKIKRDYAKKLSKEKRAKYFLYEIKFKNTLKNKIIEKIK